MPADRKGPDVYRGPKRRASDFENLPPNGGGAQARPVQVIDMAHAVATSEAHVIEHVRLRMWTDWLRGVDELALRIVYRDKKVLGREVVERILRWAAIHVLRQKDQQIEVLKAEIERMRKHSTTVLRRAA